MSDSSRRGFLALAGAGVAAGAAAVALPGAAGASQVEDSTLPHDAAESMVVHVSDVRSGKATLMIDGAEVVVTDRALVARIARAFARAQA